MTSTIEILLIENDDLDAEHIERKLRQTGDLNFNICRLQNNAVLSTHLSGNDLDAIIANFNLAKSSDRELFETIKDNSDAALIILTDYQGTFGVEAIRNGASDFLAKSDLEWINLGQLLKFAIARKQKFNAIVKSNETLQNENAQLSKLCDMSHEFVDNVSHEFRTPLTVIREYASIIKDGIDGATTVHQQNRLATIISRTDDLARMVDDLLDTSRLKSGLVKTFRRKIKLRDCVVQAARFLNQKANIKQIELSTQDIPNDLFVFCDKEKLDRTFINLISNAIKYTPLKGQISIEFDAQSNDQFVTLFVKDNGPGIPKSYLTKIFDRFNQVSGAQRTASSKGFGLGLSIASSLTRLNLGEMSVESEEGHGSTFIVKIPKADNRSIMDCYLDTIARLDKPIKLEVLEVCAVDFENHASNSSSIIEEFLCSSLADHDLAIKVADRRWRIFFESENRSSSLLIQRFKENWIEQRETAINESWPNLEFEFLDRFEFPNSRDEIARRGQLIQAKSVHQPKPKGLKIKRHILVINDDVEISEVIKTRLQSAGYDVTTAYDEVSGYALAHESKPDAIILNSSFPSCDGISVLNQLKHDPQLMPIPVVLLSASLENKSLALESGAACFLQKPFKSNFITDAINNLLNRQDINESFMATV